MKSIRAWLDSKEKPICFLYGLAEKERSLIAKTIVRNIQSNGQHVVSLFCSRETHYELFPILAIQLAYRFPRFRSNLVQVLKNSPSIYDKELPNQMEELIFNPLQKYQIPSMVIVLDRLDQYKDKGEKILACLDMVKTKIANTKIKILITCHLRQCIPEGFSYPVSISQDLGLF